MILSINRIDQFQNTIEKTIYFQAKYHEHIIGNQFEYVKLKEIIPYYFPQFSSPLYTPSQINP